jgi:outer membrane receptor protein involved in Fe transport
MNKCRTALLISSGLAAMLAGAPALAAQSTAEAPPAVDASAEALKEGDGGLIVVTAQKREEAILDIPQSVTVVGGETLERQHAVSFQDYLSQVPGLSLEQSEPGVGRIMLRGVNTGGVSSTVAVYVDETPFGSSTGLVNGAILAGDFDTFDLDRIEVLRGPQGTLYGANSLGGILKFVTAAPKLGKFDARGRAGLEFVNEGGTGYNASGMVNVPLGDVAAFRASGFYRKNAGWIDAVAGNFLGVPSIVDKDINEGQAWGGRGSVLFKPTPELSIRLTAVAQHIESDASSFAEVDQEDYDPIDGELTQTVFNREPNELKYRLYNGVIDYDFGFATLVSSTSFGKSDQTFTDDATATFGTTFNFLFGPLNPDDPASGLPPPVTDVVIGAFQDQQTDLRKFTQEIRLASPSNDTIEWMVGGYYTHEDGKIDQFIGANDLATGVEFTDPVLGDLAVARLDSDYKELAGFANATWHATDRFDITAGGRLSKNKQSATQFSAGNPFLVGAGGTLETKSDESVFTYSLSPRFDISDTTAVYARVAKGYRPGGPNVVPPTAGPDVPRTFGADTLTSYEVGLKTDIGRRLALDVSVYHLKWKDIQLFTVIDNFGLNINGTGAISNGIEGSLTLRPMNGLSVAANAAWIDAHLTGDTPPLVGGFDGDRLPWVPKTSFSLTTDYEWKLSNSATAYVGGTLAYTGSQRDNFQAGEIVGIDSGGDFIFEFSPQRRVPDYATIDLRAGVDFGHFSVDAYVRNLTNTRGISSLATVTDQLTGANGLPNDAIRASLTRPRTIGLSLTAGL